MINRRIFLAVSFALLLGIPTQAVRAEAPAEPTESLNGPVITASDDGMVTIESPVDTCDVRYTIDGTNPVLRSGKYLAPVQLAPGYTLKARIFTKDRLQQSPVATAAFSLPEGEVKLASSLVPVTQDRDAKYDWAQRHEEVCATMKAQKPEVIFIGDSITHFFSASLWKARFEKYRAVNLGYGWDRTENVIWRIQHGELDDASPKVAVVLIGTNNLEKNTDGEIAAGIGVVCWEIHKRLPNTKILLQGIFPRGAKPDAKRERIKNINKLIGAFDGQNGVVFYDFGDKFLEPDGSISKDVMGDYLHPTLKGYEIWADAIEPGLKEMVGEAKP